MWAGTCRACLDSGEKLGLIGVSGVEAEGTVMGGEVRPFWSSLNGREAALLFGERSELMFPVEAGGRRWGSCSVGSGLRPRLCVDLI